MKENVESLKAIFENINNLLQFAEAKNGAVFAVVISILMGSSDLIEDCSKSGSYLSMCTMTISIILLSISALFALASFFPNLFKVNPDKNGKSSKKNVVLFSDCAKYSNGQDYLDDFYGKYQAPIEDKSGNSIANDYAVEIISNSKICNTKFIIFKTACIFCFAGLFFLFLTMALKLYKA